MDERNIQDYIYEELSFDDQRIAFDFIEYLKENEMEFVKDNGYWKDKIYYLIIFNTKYVCFISIKDPDEKDNHWTIWSDDMDSNWFDKFSIEKRIKETAWKYIDFCDNCGSCGGGRHKVIFGKEFENVCGCTFRIDNPDTDALLFMKKMVQIRKKEILSSTK
ncbi:MAG: hypothetical protein K0S41_3831 [Anaerocolumna sp.]|jgi:hypothetical protein|nr:hypothetical protein [Anaerocolumna sp.]